MYTLHIAKDTGGNGPLLNRPRVPNYVASVPHKTSIKLAWYENVILYCTTKSLYSILEANEQIHIVTVSLPWRKTLARP